MQLLLDRGADVNLRGWQFGNALQAAVARGRVDIVKLLLSHGAKIDPPGPEWEKLLSRLRDGYQGDERVTRLRQFQEDRKGFLANERTERG